MGTNYYLHVLKDDACAHCKRPATIERLHIGKSSTGWYFSLHVIPERGINDLIDWVLFMTFAPPGTKIKDEYGQSIEFVKLMDVITRRYHPHPVTWSEVMLRQNDAIQAQHGLVRFKIDGKHCIKHGAGTWDLIIGEFR